MTYSTETKDGKALYDTINSWLGEQNHGYSDLHPSIKLLLAFFLPVWSVFEFKATKTRANGDSIRAYVDAAVPEAASVEALQPALDFFTDRYGTAPDAKRRFNALVKNNSAQAPDIQNVLHGATSAPQSKVLCLLLIVYCLRNNLAHGTKWEWGFEDQYANLVHAANVIMRTLDSFPVPSEKPKMVVR